jgi:hypothetical protein
VDSRLTTPKASALVLANRLTDWAEMAARGAFVNGFRHRSLV